MPSPRSAGTEYLTIPGQGTRIHDNYVRPGPARYAIGSAGQGIEINGHGSFAVELNEVVCDNPNAIGIFGFGFEQFRFGPLVGPVIRHNTIRLNTEPFGAVGVAFIGEVSGAFVATCPSSLSVAPSMRRRSRIRFLLFCRDTRSASSRRRGDGAGC